MLTLRQRNFDNTLTPGPGKGGGETILAGRIPHHFGRILTEVRSIIPAEAQGCSGKSGFKHTVSEVRARTR
jgi:hypothetical protein